MMNTSFYFIFKSSNASQVHSITWPVH